MLRIIEVLNSTLPKFLIVGLLGTITNISIFYVLVDLYHFQPIIISVVSFFISNFQNYLLNLLWTFQNNPKKGSFLLEKYFLYLSVNIIGLIINLVTLKIIISYFDPKIISVAQLVGILSATTINYFGSRYLVFNYSR